MTCSNGHQNVPKPAAIKFSDLDVTLGREVRKLGPQILITDSV
jgi:hypothetical protein